MDTELFDNFLLSFDCKSFKLVFDVPEGGGVKDSLPPEVVRICRGVDGDRKRCYSVLSAGSIAVVKGSYSY